MLLKIVRTVIVFLIAILVCIFITQSSAFYEPSRYHPSPDEYKFA